MLNMVLHSYIIILWCLGIHEEIILCKERNLKLGPVIYSVSQQFSPVYLKEKCKQEKQR